MFKKALFLIVILLLSFSVSFVRVELTDSGEKMQLLADYKGKSDEKEKCEGLFGNPNDDDSFAHLLQLAFTIIKYAGPLLCIVFSSIDLVKTVVADDKDAMSKTVKKCLKRVVLALILFFIPTVINYLFPLLGFYGTCGIN